MYLCPLQGSCAARRFKGSSETKTFVARVRMLCQCCAGAANDAYEMSVCEQRDAERVENASFSYGSDTVIEFITDVEGHWEYFLRLAHCSKVLYWDEEERGVWGPGILRIRANGMLVFGGDAPDKGPGDIRLVKTLLSLKRRFPQQAPRKASLQTVFKRSSNGVHVEQIERHRCISSLATATS